MSPRLGAQSRSRVAWAARQAGGSRCAAQPGSGIAVLGGLLAIRGLCRREHLSTLIKPRLSPGEQRDVGRLTSPAGAPEPSPLAAQEPGFLTASLAGLFPLLKLTRASAEWLEGAGLAGAPDAGCAGAGPQAQLCSTPPRAGQGALPHLSAPRALSPHAVELPGSPSFSLPTSISHSSSTEEFLLFP